MATEQARMQGRAASEGVGDNPQEAAAQARQQVQQKAEEAKGRASQRAREQLDTRSTQLGEQVTSVGQALRKAGEHLQGEGNEPAAKVAEQAAEQVERLAGYLTGSGSDRFLSDIERFGRQRPWAAAGIGVVTGFVGARFVKASSESRYESSYRPQPVADLPLSRDEDATAVVPPVTELPPYGDV